MKKKFLFLMALLAVSLLAWAEMTIYVYKKDGTKVPYVASTVDSIGVVDVNDIADGHEWVDLGLPSGTKWATCNVGADSPEDYGDYFAWGETTPKSTYNWSTYKWCKGSYDTQTKYCTKSYYGTVDNKTTLDLSDDAAYVNWGSSCRMPTKAEQDELRNTSYTTWTWTTQNGVKGYKVTSKTNGNSIFLPAAGYRYNSDLSRAGSDGYYWSSSLDTSNSYDAYYLYFLSGNVSSYDVYRNIGHSVRPVLADVHTITFNANGGEGIIDVFYVKDGESVTLPANTFTNGLSTFVGWNTAANGSGTAYADMGTVKPTANITLYAQWEAPKDTGIADGHEWVDLGLPSGTKWATCNVGADSPEDYGDYFAWGETTPKSSYTGSNYNYSSNPNTLPLGRDAAYVNWGTSWRMPTTAEVKELKDNCTWTMTTQKGVKGYKVTSKTNGNSIFLPAAGYRYYSDLYDAGSVGYYWSSSVSTGDSYFAYRLCFNSVGVNSSSNERRSGLSVRPVLQ